jgi:hypothetical protein
VRRPLGYVATFVALLHASIAADAGAQDFFTAERGRIFGYTLGAATGEARPVIPERRALAAELAPFTEVRLSWSQPSGTLYDVSGSGRVRSSRACVEKLGELRARFNTTQAIPLREESFEATNGDPYLGYYGTRDSVTWRLSCQGRLLSITATDERYDWGCDPREQPPRPEPVIPAEWAERYPGLGPSAAPEIAAVWRRIADRAEGSYNRMRAQSGCLEGLIAISAVIDSEGAVQAVETRSSGFPDATLERAAKEIVRTTPFPKDAAALWRLTTVELKFAHH